MQYLKSNKYYFLSISLLFFSLDQLTKYLININYKNLLNKDFFLFSITKVKNFGAAFNILSGNRVFLSIISIAISIALIYMILEKNNTRNIDLYCYSFILGGSLGNGIDRIFRGYVLDFIDLNFINFPVFNLADITINIGFIIIIYSVVKYK